MCDQKHYCAVLRPALTLAFPRSMPSPPCRAVSNSRGSLNAAPQASEFAAVKRSLEEDSRRLKTEIEAARRLLQHHHKSRA